LALHQRMGDGSRFFERTAGREHESFVGHIQ
jgi:hypothetical protein